MLWKTVIGHTLKNLALSSRDAELALKVPREEINEFIVERFGELMEKYNSMSGEALDKEYARFQEEGKELIKQKIEEITRGEI